MDDLSQIFKNLGDGGGATGGGDQRMQHLLNFVADFRGNRSNLRLADNCIEKKVEKVNEDYWVPKVNCEDDKTGKGNAKTCELMKEKARALAANSKYYEASALLESMGEIDDDTDLGTKLLKAVCYLQLGRESKANRSIKGIRESLLRDPTLTADEALDLIDSLVDSDAYASALILLPVASGLYKRQLSGDDALDGLFRCSHKASGCTSPMISEGGRARILAIDFGVDFMVETLDEMKNLEGADPQKRALKQCLATTWIAYDFWLLKDNLKGIRLRESALVTMEEAFGMQAAKQHRVYGNTLYNIGVGYDIVGKHSKAKEAYERAIDAIDCAIDFDSDFLRQRESNMCKQKLRELHK